jgi:hypothetical protein
MFFLMKHINFEVFYVMDDVLYINKVSFNDQIHHNVIYMFFITLYYIVNIIFLFFIVQFNIILHNHDIFEFIFIIDSINIF